MVPSDETSPSNDRAPHFTDLATDLADLALFRARPDEARTIEWLGEGFERLTGYSPSRLLDEGRGMRELLHPDDRRRVGECIQEALREGTSYRVDYRLINADDAVVEVRERGRPKNAHTSGEVRIEGLLAANHPGDAPGEASPDEDRPLRLALEATDTGVWYWNIPDDEIGWNQATYEIFGTELHDFEDFTSLIAPEDRPRVEQAVQRSVQEGSHYHEDFRIRHGRSGDERWVSAWGETHFEDGEPVRLLGTVRDVTDQKRTERALRQSERRFRQVAETLDELVFLMDADGSEFLYVSPAFEDIWGHPPEALVEDPSLWLEGVHPDDTARVRREFNRDFSAGDYDIQYRVVHPDDEVRWLHVRGYPVTDDRGNVERMAGLAQDITELKEVRMATEAKSEFLAQMSHDIRTPMNAIIGMSDLLSETDLSPEQRHHVDIVREAGRSLLTLINNILDLSKIESDELTLNHSLFSPHRLVKSITSIFAQMAHEKGLELNLNVEPSLPAVVRGDENRIRQILVNLMSNAVKFTDEGEVVLRARSPGPESGHLHFEIQDTGRGIPEEDRGAIFDDYRQTRRVGQGDDENAGTGLGLAICVNLVDLMDGAIRVDSEVGVGSTFHIELPLEYVPREEAEEMDELSMHAPHLDLSGTQVLIVEDNATNRLILKNMLEDWGAVVHLAEDAAQGLDQLRAFDDPAATFDLVITDNKLPDMDGFEFVRKVKDGTTLQEQTFVMLTSTDAMEGAQQAEQLGLAGYMIKPVSRYELARLIQKSQAADHTRTVTRSDLSEPSEQGADLAVSPEVLIVEDNTQNQRVVQAYLQPHGVELEFVENGREAVEYVQQHADSLDLVLMDMKMPVMDGYEATRRIRAWENQHDREPLPIVAVTAQAMVEDQSRCLEAGCDAYLAKPLERKTLFRVLERCLHRSAPSVQLDPADLGTSPNDDPLDGVDNVLIDLVPEFVADGLDEYDKLQNARADEDYETLETVAHGLKGAADTYGFDQLAEAARKLEHAGERESGWETVDRQLEALERALQHLKQAIDHRDE